MSGSKDTKVRPPNPKQLGLQITGTFYLCPNLPGKPCALYTFQGVRPGLGNIPGYPKKDRQMRRWVKPRDPKTLMQLTRRLLFSEAVADWLGMSPQEQANWYIDGRTQQRSGFNAWMSYALRGGIRI